MHLQVNALKQDIIMQFSKTNSIYFPIVGIMILCACLLSACISTSDLGFGGSSMPKASNATIADARDAWDRGNMQNAENLYGKATKMSLPQAEQSEAWERYAIAAARNGRPNNALVALENWQNIVPGAEQSVAWQNAWRNSVRLLSPSSGVEQATKLWNNRALHDAARAQAAIVLMGRSWSAATSMSAVPMLTSYYASLDLGHRQDAERFTAEEMHYMTTGTLQDLGSRLASADTVAYPASIILLEQVRRALPMDMALRTRVLDSALYADTSLPQQVLANMTNTSSASASSASPASVGAAQATPPPVAPSGYQNACLVLALPHSGPAASIAQKVRAGADAAKVELEQRGTQMSLHHIDTAQDTWLSQIDTLPPECAVVGGLMQRAEYTAAKSGAAMSKRNYFAFLPVLEGQDEGSLAWRFFPSPEDQVQALLGFTAQMGIKSYGSFYPADSYGARMNTIFSESATAAGSQVQAVSYLPNDKAQWLDAATKLFQPQRINNIPFPTSNLGAIFLPDSWKNMDLITQAMLYNGEDRPILMGTSLWEQSLLGGQVNTTATTKNYSLAIFPAAWNPASKPQALSTMPAADFWTVLGYDFVRLGSNLALAAPVPANELNTRLQSAQQMSFAMAPIKWSMNGKAKQELFLFTLTDGGVMPADASIMQQRRIMVINNFDVRYNAAQKAIVK